MIHKIFFKSHNKNQGITLIALVVTIVVLLILAGVNISAITGDNGIIKRAAEAKENYDQASETELAQIDAVEALTLLMSGEYLTKTTTLDMNGTITVPAGYKLASDSPTDITKGVVIEDSNGNQWVWIPCTTDSKDTDSIQYARTKWGVEYDNETYAKLDEKELASYTNDEDDFDDTDITYGINSTVAAEIVTQIGLEEESIATYGGYYIGRYEVGTDDGTTSGTAVVKKNQTPYASIRWSVAYSLAQGIDGVSGIDGNGDVATYLCSSYSWDTAVTFIQTYSEATSYATSRIYPSGTKLNENWSDYDVLNTAGTIIKEAGTATRLSTGLTTSQCNIYDIGGNVSEMTTEINPGTGSETVVLRGGTYIHLYLAGYRWDANVDHATSYGGFRATLFIQ